MKCGTLIFLIVSLALAGCGNTAGIFEKVAGSSSGAGGFPGGTAGGSISGGDGYTAPVRQDYTQAFEYAAYDILWVLDNSGSMSEEISYVRSNVERISQIMKTRRTIEYQMAVINTDWRDLTKGHGKFRGPVPIIKYNDADPVAEFKAAVDDINYCGAGGGAGCGTSGNEMGLNSARQALTDNAGTFIRNKANLFVIIASDEEDQSCVPNGAGTGCQAGGAIVSTATFVTYFNTVKPSGSGAVAYYPVVGIQNQTGCTFASLGTRYLDVLTGLGSGDSGSICLSDIDNTFNHIANAIADNGLCFSLAYAPNPTSVNVYVDGALVVSGYSLDTVKNAVCFDTNHIPQNGQKVGIEYLRK